jgi:hypothetical protein
MTGYSVDIGNLCIECRKDTSFGSGRFVNRIPASDEEEDGYMCEACQTSDECFDCGKAPVFGDTRCEECGDKYEQYNSQETI